MRVSPRLLSTRLSGPACSAARCSRAPAARCAASSRSARPSAAASGPSAPWSRGSQGVWWHLDFSAARHARRSAERPVHGQRRCCAGVVLAWAPWRLTRALDQVADARPARLHSRPARSHADVARRRAHLRRRQLRRVVGRRGADGALQVVRAAAEAQHAHRQRALRRRARRRRPLRAPTCRGRTALCPSSRAAEAPAACSSECLGSRPSIAAASNCGATNGCGHMLTQSDAANYCAAFACSRTG